MSINLNWDSEIDFDLFSIVQSGKTLKLKYDNQNFKIISDTVYCPFDCSENTQSWAQHKQWSVSCNILNNEFANLLNKIDAKIKSLLQDKEYIDESTLYRNVLYSNTNYTTLRLNIKRNNKDGNFISSIFDIDKNKIYINDNNISNQFTKNYMKAVFECEKLYVYNNKAGSVWNLDQSRFVVYDNEEFKNVELNEQIVNCLIED